MGIISTGPGSPLAFSSASGGKVYAYNNLTVNPQLAVPANTQRQSVTFHNPGIVDIFIYPQFVINTGSNVALVPAVGALGGCYRVYGNGGTLVITGECQGQWGAFAASGVSNPLTVTDTNI